MHSYASASWLQSMLSAEPGTGIHLRWGTGIHLRWGMFAFELAP